MFKAQAEQRAAGELFEAKKRENKRRHHHVIFIVCAPIDQRFRPISTWEITQLL